MAPVGAFSSAQADTIHVDDDNCPGPGDGSALNPYRSIHAAIDNAVDSDEIVVAPGTHFETIDFLSKAVWLHSPDGPEVTTVTHSSRPDTCSPMAGAVHERSGLLCCDVMRASLPADREVAVRAAAEPGPVSSVTGPH